MKNDNYKFTISIVTSGILFLASLWAAVNIHQAVVSVAAQTQITSAKEVTVKEEGVYIYLVNVGENTFMIALLDPNPDNSIVAKLQEDYFSKIDNLEWVNMIVIDCIGEEGNEEFARQILNADYVLTIVTDDMGYWKTIQIVTWCISGGLLLVFLILLMSRFRGLTANNKY